MCYFKLHQSLGRWGQIMWVWMERAMRGWQMVENLDGEERKCISLPSLHIWTLLAPSEPATSRPVFYLLITRRFYWLVTLLAAWNPKMVLNLEELEPGKRYCSDRPTARRKPGLTALPFVQPALPSRLREEGINWPVETLRFIDLQQSKKEGGDGSVSAMKMRTRDVISSDTPG